MGCQFVPLRCATSALTSESQTDNALRKHNYISLIHSLLLAMAKEGKLTESIADAKEDMKKKIAEQKAKGGDSSMEQD